MHIGTKTNTQNYKKAAQLALASFISNLPNFILVTISALTACSTVVWVDVLVSFGETTHAALVWLVTRKMVRETGDKYNFGTDRLEVFFSFVCDLLVTVGMACVAVGAVFNILSPETPTNSILLFCILKCVNSTYDVIALHRQTKITKENPSNLNETERVTYRNSLISDVAVGVLALICYLLRGYTFALYLSPVISIVLTVYFIFGYVKHMKISFGEIVDQSLTIRRQDEIYDIVLSNRAFIKRISEVNCRRINGKTHIELSLVFDEAVTYGQMRECLAEIRAQVELLEPNCFVCFVIE